MWLEIILGALAPLLVAAISYGFALLRKWVLSKIKNEKLQQVVEHVLGFTEDVVLMVNQTYVNNLKDENLFDLVAQKEAFNRAFNAAKSMITEEKQRILEAAFGNVDVWLASLIESKVEEAKKALVAK